MVQSRPKATRNSRNGGLFSTYKALFWEFPAEIEFWQLLRLFRIGFVKKGAAAFLFAAAPCFAGEMGGKTFRGPSASAHVAGLAPCFALFDTFLRPSLKSESDG